MEWVAVGLFGFIAWAAVRSTSKPLPTEAELVDVPPGKFALDTEPRSSVPIGESMETYGSAGDD